MVISICCRQEAIVCANNVFLGKLLPSGTLSLPLGDNPTLLTAFLPFSQGCLWCYLFLEDGRAKISSPCARLSLINDELAELEFLPFSKNLLSPPIVTNEAHWGDAIAGICDGWFLVQTSKQTLYFKTHGVLSFTVLNELFVLLHFCDSSIIIDRTLEARLILSSGEFIKNGNVLEETFSSFSFFKLKRRFDLRTLEKISQEVVSSTPSTPFERICCFCEAVRLGFKDEALALMTPSLAEELNFEQIREFLGPFDKIEHPRYDKAGNENAFFLRYALDECNFHYICYEVEFHKTIGCDLIDNICEA